MNSFKKNDFIIFDIILYDYSGNGYKFKSVLDTGAKISFITNNIFNKLKLEKVGSGKITLADNRSSDAGTSNVKISLPNHKSFVNINVGIIPDKESFDFIFGIDLLSYSNINIDTTLDGFQFKIEIPSCL